MFFSQFLAIKVLTNGTASDRLVNMLVYLWMCSLECTLSTAISFRVMLPLDHVFTAQKANLRPWLFLTVVAACSLAFSWSNKQCITWKIRWTIFGTSTDVLVICGMCTDPSPHLSDVEFWTVIAENGCFWIIFMYVLSLQVATFAKKQKTCSAFFYSNFSI